MRLLALLLACSLLRANASFGDREGAPPVALEDAAVGFRVPCGRLRGADFRARENNGWARAPPDHLVMSYRIGDQRRGYDANATLTLLHTAAAAASDAAGLPAQPGSLLRRGRLERRPPGGAAAGVRASSVIVKGSRVEEAVATLAVASRLTCRGGAPSPWPRGIVRLEAVIPTAMAGAPCADNATALLFGLAGSPRGCAPKLQVTVVTRDVGPVGSLERVATRPGGFEMLQRAGARHARCSAWQALGSLATLHEHNIVHGDVHLGQFYVREVGTKTTGSEGRSGVALALALGDFANSIVLDHEATSQRAAVRAYHRAAAGCVAMASTFVSRMRAVLTAPEIWACREHLVQRKAGAPPPSRWSTAADVYDFGLSVMLTLFSSYADSCAAATQGEQGGVQGISAFTLCCVLRNPLSLMRSACILNTTKTVGCLAHNTSWLQEVTADYGRFAALQRAGALACEDAAGKRIAGCSSGESTRAHAPAGHTEFVDSGGLRLVWQMMRWPPTSRITASAARKHPFFKGCDKYLPPGGGAGDENFPPGGGAGDEGVPDGDTSDALDDVLEANVAARTRWTRALKRERDVEQNKVLAKRSPSELMASIVASMRKRYPAVPGASSPSRLRARVASLAACCTPPPCCSRIVPSLASPHAATHPSRPPPVRAEHTLRAMLTQHMADVERTNGADPKAKITEAVKRTILALALQK